MILLVPGRHWLHLAIVLANTPGGILDFLVLVGAPLFLGDQGKQQHGPVVWVNKDAAKDVLNAVDCDMAHSKKSTESHKYGR